MSRFSKSIKESLKRNPNIVKVSSNLIYTFKFKKEAVKVFKSGASLKEIFRRADIDLSLFGTKYAKNSIWRWIKIVEKYGYEGLKEEHCGIHAKGRPIRQFKSEQE